MARHPSLLPLLLLGALAAAHAAKLPRPSYIKPCSIKDLAGWNACVTKSAQDVVGNLVKGDAKYRLPSVDPLHISYLVLTEKGNQLGVQIVAEDVLVHGLKDIQFKSSAHSENPPQDTYDVFIPHFDINGKYNMTGKLLLLPIVGNGDGDVKVENVHIKYTHGWELKKKKDGETYYFPKRGETVLNTTHLYVHLDNLFNGDKQLGDTTNKFLNENWQDLFNALRASVGDIITEVAYTSMKGVYEQVPYKDVFLDTGM